MFNGFRNEKTTGEEFPVVLLYAPANLALYVHDPPRFQHQAVRRSRSGLADHTVPPTIQKSGGTFLRQPYNLKMLLNR
jgi:hypothetical protein